jgi:protocatechuate 3,4-dioxygenase alpha subunit
MPQTLDRLKETASQTAGPYVHIGLTPNACGMEGVYREDLGTGLVSEKVGGERITITGQVIDGAGAPLRDCLIEIWQADSNGVYNAPSDTRGSADPGFTGWARAAADAETGIYQFRTIKPGAVPFRDGRLMAPHITFWIVARGINIGLHTRMYFPEEQDANAKDPVLARIGDPSRAETLIARRDASTLTFNICLQGPDETVFFDI